MKIRRKLWTWLIAIVLVLSVVAAGANVWVESLYPVQEAARAALVPLEHLTVAQTDDAIVFLPSEAKAGFIFYPGGLVPAEAYAPLMHALAEEGVLCVVPKMPLRLAVLDMSAADGIAEQYPGITRWTIGGHSLGGAMAASYAAAHPGDFAALALLAAYSTEPLPDDLAVVSLCGTADRVLDWEKYEASRVNLPATAQEIAIPGGNHAQFGSYGAQEGDGEATISARVQLNAAVDALLPLLTGE